MGLAHYVSRVLAGVALALVTAHSACAGRVAQDATAERLRLESELLARVTALSSPAELEPLLARIQASALVARMKPPLVHLAVERALELERSLGHEHASPLERTSSADPATGAQQPLARRLDPRSLPLATRALFEAALPGAFPQGPVPRLPTVSAARPAMTTARPQGAVVFVVDGLRKDILDGMLAAGRLPHIRKHLLDRGFTVDRMVSVFPTVTPPNAATMLTGVLPDRHKIPALAWYDGSAGTARLYTSLRARDVNRDLPASETTLWEYLRDQHQVATVGMPIERGAWYRWFHLFYPDKALASVGGKYLDHSGWLPPVLGMWFLDLDTASHLGGTFSPGVEQSLEKLDRELGALCDTLIRRGTYDRTLFVWASDHGSQPTLRNVDIVGDLARAGLTCKTLDLKIDPFVSKAMELRLKGAPAVCINLGAGSGSLYLKGAQNVPDVEAALRSLDGRRGAKVDVLDALTRHSAVDVVAFTRAPGVVRVLSAHGTGEIASRRVKGRFEARWAVVNGEDPLEVSRELHGRWLAVPDWVAATADTRRPAAVPGIAAFLASGRGGDVVFTSRPGVNFSRHFHTRGGYHGGLSHGEAITRLIMAGPGVPHARLASASMADVTPTLLALLDVPHDASRLDGRSFLAPRIEPRVVAVSALDLVAGAPVGAGLGLPDASALDSLKGARPARAADRGGATGDRTRLGFSVDPQLEVTQLYRVPDWRLDARGDTAPWWPLLLPAAMPGSAVQMDFRRPIGRGDLVASPGLVRTDRGVKAGDRVYPTLDLRAATPLTATGRAWVGLTGGAEILADGDRVHGRADAGVLVTCEITRRLRAFGFAGPFSGSVSSGDAGSPGLRVKSGLELFTGGNGSAMVEAVRDEHGAGEISRVSAVVNLPAF